MTVEYVPQAPILEGYAGNVVDPLPITVLSAQWQTLKLSKKKTEKVLVVTYSGALNPSDAQDLAAYELFSQARKKFTKRDSLTSATYNSSNNTVTLTPKGGKIPTQPLELEIIAADVLDPLGRPLAGNGTPGGNYVVVLPRGVSAAAVDALLVGDQLTPTRGRAPVPDPPLCDFARASQAGKTGLNSLFPGSRDPHHRPRHQRLPGSGSKHSIDRHLAPEDPS